MTFGLRRQWSSRLNGERVGRHMRRIERQRARERALPIDKPFASAAVNEIEIERGDAT